MNLGDYRLLERVGGGGMGEVWRAENVHTRVAYAVKLLPEEATRDPRFVARFFDEGRVMSELDHPRIVRVHHVGEGDLRADAPAAGPVARRYYLAMDFVAGPDGRARSLHDLLAEAPEHRLPEREVKRWAAQVAEALAYAHGRGVVHRDIKPANVLVDKDGNARVADFGLAKAIGETFIQSQIHVSLARGMGAAARKAPPLAAPHPAAPGRAERSLSAEPTLDTERGGTSRGRTTADALLGTYDYMAPEQRGELPEVEVSAATDIYAFGVMLYRLLTGRRPTGMAEPPSALAPGLSRGWDAITRRCLKHQPAERYASADALRQAIARVPLERRWPRWAGAATLVLVLAGASFYVSQTSYRSYRARAAAAASEREAGPQSGPAGGRTLPGGSFLDEIRAIGEYADAKKMFEAALAQADAEVLKAFGGAAWIEVETQRRIGAANAKDPAAGKAAYEAALANLPAAVRAAEAGRQSTVLAASLSAAGAARERGAWEDVLAGADRALGLEPGNAAAQALKAEAEQNLVPSLRIVAETDGHEVPAQVNDGKTIYETPVTLPLAAGQRYEFTVSYASNSSDRRRWAPATLAVTADWRGTRTNRVALTGWQYPDLRSEWENSLGMKFAPVPGTEALFAVWETRVGDFRAFVEDQARNERYDYRAAGGEPYGMNADGITRRGPTFSWQNPGFSQDDTHPVTCVSSKDAEAFCRWLTRKEREAGLIGPDQAYRLPRDWEWSAAVGLDEPRAGSPKDKDEQVRDRYPWDRGRGAWPPARGAGNYDPGLNTDDFDRTSPVGAFGPQAHGLFDLGGNVWEWCADEYDRPGGTRVLRGGSWRYAFPRRLLSSYRDHALPEERNIFIGFRVVLAAATP